MSSRVKLFLTGLLQVSLVSINVYQVSHGFILGATIVGFLISAVWTFNVKGVAFGDAWDRIAYAGGAAVGTTVGTIAGPIIH